LNRLRPSTPATQVAIAQLTSWNGFETWRIAQNWRIGSEA
jgi:hypothetical protein